MEQNVLSAHLNVRPVRMKLTVKLVKELELSQARTHAIAQLNNIQSQIVNYAPIVNIVVQVV
jgi:hypothetical protein